MLSLFVFIAFQSVYSLSVFLSFERSANLTALAIENRIAKDFARLPLPNSEANIAGDERVVRNYIKLLNRQLLNQSVQTSVTHIGDIKVDDVHQGNLAQRQILLDTPSQIVPITISYAEPTLLKLIGPFAVICAIGFFFILNFRLKTQQIKLRLNSDSVASVTKLVIDLENKCLLNSTTGVQVPLANKPLCFYTALVEFCIEDKETVLNQNKDLPDDLLQLADKYFYRLVELGHTIRKRPNFSNSLEKTLSEVRAALDEVFANDVQTKEIYYPPKAHGEGSRSKLHHYGLNTISDGDVEVIGK